MCNFDSPYEVPDEVGISFTGRSSTQIYARDRNGQETKSTTYQCASPVLKRNKFWRCLHESIFVTKNRRWKNWVVDSTYASSIIDTRAF